MTNKSTDAALRGFSWKHLTLPVLCMAGVVALSNVLVQYPLGEWLTYAAFSYPLAYFVTEVCNRWAGPVLARRVAWAGFATGVALSLWFVIDWSRVTWAGSVWGVARSIVEDQDGWRIALGSGTAFIVSQMLDIAVFNRLRNKSWWKAPLWAASAASVLDTMLFFSIAFAGTPVPWLKLATGDLGVKLVMAVVLLAPFRVLTARMGQAARAAR
jgi:uncharacterized integral membrane protein (TIGR00697 family)